MACACFAWGPTPARVELVRAEDLLQGVVRRRAVFQWRDTVRAGREIHYAVQKLASNGATHIPDVQEAVARDAPASA